MKIERIVTYPLAVPLNPEYFKISALGTHEVSEYLVLRIESDAGLDSFRNIVDFSMITILPSKGNHL